MAVYCIPRSCKTEGLVQTVCDILTICITMMQGVLTFVVL